MKTIDARALQRETRGAPLDDGTVRELRVRLIPCKCAAY